VYPTLQAHAVTAELVLGEFVFTGHTKQADATVAPTITEYFPVEQPVHDPLPLKSLYVPAPHASHGPPFGPVYPALQTQAVTTVLRLGELEFAGHVKQLVTAEAPVEAEYLPAAQLVHPALPLVSLYVPAPHGTHGPPSGPECPALHVHAKDEVLIAGELEFRGHTPQLDADEAPTVLECVPDPQLEQSALPLAILYVPATHAEHVPPFGPVYPALQSG
jgi:hypothetical protein